MRRRAETLPSKTQCDIRLNAPAIRTLAQNVAAQTVYRYTFTGLRTGLYYPYIVGFAANYPAQR